MSSTNGEPIEAETGRPNLRSRNDDNMHDECMPNDQTGEDAHLQENEGKYNS